MDKLDVLSDQELREYILLLASQQTRPPVTVSERVRKLFLLIPRTGMEYPGLWLRQKASELLPLERERVRRTLNEIVNEHSPGLDDERTLHNLGDFCMNLRLNRATPALLRLSEILQKREESKELAHELIGIVAGFSPDTGAVDALKSLLLQDRINPKLAASVFCAICEGQPDEFTRCFPAFIKAYDQLPTEDRGDKFTIAAILRDVPAPTLLPQIAKLAPEHRARVVQWLKEYASDQFQVQDGPDPVITLQGEHAQRQTARRSDEKHLR